MRAEIDKVGKTFYIVDAKTRYCFGTATYRTTALEVAFAVNEVMIELEGTANRLGDREQGTGYRQESPVTCHLSSVPSSPCHLSPPPREEELCSK